MPAGLTAIGVMADMRAIGRLFGVKIKPFSPDMFVF
jgi:hypothetical protein